MILSSFNNLNTDLLQIVQEYLKGIYKLINKLIKLWLIIRLLILRIFEGSLKN